MNTKVKGVRRIILSREGYHNRTRPCFKDIINNLKKSDPWKIQLTIANKFIPSTDNNEERVMHSKNDYIKTMINNEAEEVIKELYDSLKKKKSK